MHHKGKNTPQRDKYTTNGDFYITRGTLLHHKRGPFAPLEGTKYTTVGILKYTTRTPKIHHKTTTWENLLFGHHEKTIPTLLLPCYVFTDLGAAWCMCSTQINSIPACRCSFYVCSYVMSRYTASKPAMMLPSHNEDAFMGL